MHRFLPLLAVVLSAWILAAPPASAKSAPNIIFIQLDTARYDHTTMGGYKRDTTPFMASLARRGILFEKCYSTSTWCIPGTMSLLTGMTPSHHGVANKFSFPDGNAKNPKPVQLAESLQILPQVLKAGGWQVAAFTGQQTADSFKDLRKRVQFFHTGTKLSKFDESIPKAVKWLGERQAKGQQFFMFLHGYDPHGGTTPSGGYQRDWEAAYKGPVKADVDGYMKMRDEEWENKQKEGRFVVKTASAKDAAFMTALYDERLRAADRQLKRFVGAVEKLGLLSNTIVVVVSDHGEEMFDRGGICHGHSLYEELLHVPMIMLIPGQRGGQKIKTLVRNIDALPTAMAAAGVAVPKRDGVSLLPLLQGKKMDLVVYPETDFLLLTKKRAVRTDRYKLITTVENGSRELYDLKADPGERKNLYATQPAEAKKLEALLRQR